MKKATTRFLFAFLACLASFSSLNAQTFSATVNQSIPDNNTVVAFNIVVSGLPTAINSTFGLELTCLNMTHTYCADMEMQLRAPDGTTVLLMSGLGGGDDNFLNTCLSGVGTSITAASAPFTGTFQSQGTMGNVNNGQNPNGTWQLLCRDMAGQDIGYLTTWSITFGANPALQFGFASSNIPLVKLTTLANPINNSTKVPVHMQIIDNGPGLRNYVSDTIYAYEGNIMAEWQGFSGPSYPKKNYDFDLIDANSMEIDTPLLGMPSENDWIFKAEYLDHSLLKNTITYEMARRMGVYAPRNKPCEVFLDGDYIGFYTLTEKVKRDGDRVKVDKLTSLDITAPAITGGYIIEMNIGGAGPDWNSVYPPINNATCGFPVEFKHVYPKTADILPVQHDYIKNYVDAFEAILNGPNYTDPTTGYRSVVDIGTFIDFLIVNEFSVNYDSYGRSTYMYKENDNDGGMLKIGPPWDYDRAFEFTNPGLTNGWVWQITHPYWPFPFWWSRFYSDATYRKELACRWLMLRQDVLSNAAFTGLIDSTAALFEEGAIRNFTVWNDLGGQTYQTQVDSVKSFLSRRLTWIDNTLAVENVAPPVFYLPTDTVVCAGTVYDASFNGLQYSYNWQPGPDSALITLNQNGIQTLEVTDAYGCYSRKEMDVTISVPDASFTSQVLGGGGLDLGFQPNDPNASGYTWNFGDGGSSNLQAPTHTYAGSGTYTATLSILDSIGCAAVWMDTLQITFVGIADASLDAAVAFPNPFDNVLTLVLGAPAQMEGSFSLTNALGQTVASAPIQVNAKEIMLPTHSIPAGFYNLSVQIGESSWVQKVVKH